MTLLDLSQRQWRAFFIHSQARIEAKADCQSHFLDLLEENHEMPRTGQPLLEAGSHF